MWPASAVPVKGAMPTSRAKRNTTRWTVRPWRRAIRTNSGWSNASRLAVSREKPCYTIPLAAQSRDAYLNLMDQYAPAWQAKSNPRFADINRRLTRSEMTQAIGLARAAGLWRLDERWRVLSPWEATAGVEG